MKIYFVCMGNICRSPLAHTIMEKKLKEKRLRERFIVDSSGLGSWHVGEPSDRRMREKASFYGYTITHRAQQFHWQDSENFDYIFAMDNAVYQGILDLIPNQFENKVMLFRKFDSHYPDEDVPDPYYGNADGFEEVFQIVEKNCNSILDNFLLKKVNKI